MFKNILALTLLCASSVVSCDASATMTELYSVEGNVTTKVAPTSGLTKANCKFYDADHKVIAGQIVTVVESFDNITLIEANLYFEQHAEVTKVICK